MSSKTIHSGSKAKGRKNMRKQAKKAKIQPKNRLLAPLVITLIFACAGLYLLFVANAYEDYHVYYLDGTRKVAIAGDPNSLPKMKWLPAGYNLNLPIYADLQQPGPDGQLQLGLEFAGSSSTVKYLGFSCVTAAYCTGGANLKGEGDRELSTCISFDQSQAGAKQVHIATVHLKILVAGKYNLAWPGYAVWGDSPQRALYKIWDCKYIEPGQQGKDQDNGKGNGNGNDGDGQGVGGGGGGGGSSANKQGDKPNTVPSTSNQGNNKQPEQEPSPFFDGKQYAPGSDRFDTSMGNITVAGQNVARGWLFVLLLLVIAAGGTAYYFARIQRRKP